LLGIVSLLPLDFFCLASFLRGSLKFSCQFRGDPNFPLRGSHRDAESQRLSGSLTNEILPEAATSKSVAPRDQIPDGPNQQRQVLLLGDPQ